jgi:hypothetical protein
MVAVQNSDNSSTASNQRFSLADNMDNINNIKRMWRAKWPEFSWMTEPGDSSSRCYQMFAPDISRVGYGDPDPANNNQCKVWSIMCPQQGIWIQAIEGTLNVEVTVTSSGGWVTENPMIIDAQITIQPKIWFSPDTIQNNTLIKLIWKLFEDCGIPFPSSKANAIKLNAHGVDQKDQPVQSNVLDIKTGMDPNYPVPTFAQHNEPDIFNQKAASCAYLAVEIGEVISSGSEIADWFNGLVMEIFNLASGNLLQYQNVLSWNVWVLAPEEVFTQEWQMHADYWRFSLDVNHRSPEGSGRDPQYFSGKTFSPRIAFVCDRLQALKDWLGSVGIFSGLSIVKEIEDELATIISNNCEGKVVFL